MRDREQRLERIREAKRALEAREAELRPGREIEDKKQISFADKDARIMGKKGAFHYAYNAQIGVDGDAQIIVGQHVSQAANDQREVGRALDELEASSGRLPDKMSLDNGYYSGDNLRAASDRGVEAHIATDRGEKPVATGVDDSDRPLVKADFRYDEARDGFHCPGGQFLALRRAHARGRREYRGEAEVCAACAYHDRCCRSKSGAARTVTSDGREPLRRAMNERMSRPESRAIHSRRKAIVEPVFGQIKNTGFPPVRAQVRGGGHPAAGGSRRGLRSDVRAGHARSPAAAVRGVRRGAVRAPRDDLERARLQPARLRHVPREAHRVDEDAAGDHSHRPAPTASDRPATSPGVLGIPSRRQRLTDSSP